MKLAVLTYLNEAIKRSKKIVLTGMYEMYNPIPTMVTHQNEEMSPNSNKDVEIPINNAPEIATR